MEGEGCWGLGVMVVRANENAFCMFSTEVARNTSCMEMACGEIVMSADLINGEVLILEKQLGLAMNHHSVILPATDGVEVNADSSDNERTYQPNDIKTACLAHYNVIKAHFRP